MKKFRHSLDGMTEQLMSSVKLLLKNIVENNAEIRTVLVDIPKMMKQLNVNDSIVVFINHTSAKIVQLVNDIIVFLYAFQDK